MNGIVSRRSFLTGSAAVSAGLGAVALAGCAPQPVVEKDPKPQATEQNGDIFGTPEVIDESAITQTIEADVAVVGLGLAGVAAMRAATEGGLKVVGIEKTSGVCGRSTDFAYFNTEKARAIGIKDINTAELVNEFMKQMSYMPNFNTLKRWADNCGEAIDWYCDAYGNVPFIDSWPNAPTDENTLFCINGAYFTTAVPPYNQYDSTRDTEKLFDGTIEFNPKGHLPVLQANAELAVSKGAQTFFDSSARQLIVKDGKVTGVIFQNLNDDTYTRVNASKAVVLATGGYTHNDKMIEKYLPWIWDNKECFVFDYPHMDVKGEFVDQGDGIKMGHWAGAAIESGPHTGQAHSTLGALGVDAFLQLDANGKRYINEELTIDHFSLNVLRQPKKTIYQMFDANWFDQLDIMQGGLGTYHSDAINDEKKATINEWTTAQGQTLDELIANLGVSPEVAKTMQRSIARYNELCETGEDKDFGKCAERMFALTTPPFYAIRYTPEDANLVGRTALRFLVTMSGLTTDEYARCLDKNDDPIPGLFAVGNTQGRRFSITYPCTLAGASHSIAVTYGYLTGKYIAENL